MRAVVFSVSIMCLYGAVVAHAQDPPANPFKPRSRARADARPGTVTMSDGEEYSGRIHVTRDKRLRIYDTQAKLYRDIPLAAVKSVRIGVEKEGMEKEWRWQEGGSNVKVYTGKAYPWREYVTTITLTNDQEITGHLKATPVYVACEGKTKKLVIHQKNKGVLGQTLSYLVYIKRIVFGEPGTEAKQ